MRLNLRRRIAFVAALIVPAVAAFALSASPAFAALPRYGRLVLGTHHAVSPLAILIIVLGTAGGLILLVVTERRRSRVRNVAVSPIPVAADPHAHDTGAGRRAA